MQPTDGGVYARPGGKPEGQPPVPDGPKPILSVVGEELLRIIGGTGRELVRILLPVPRARASQDEYILLHRCTCGEWHRVKQSA